MNAFDKAKLTNAVAIVESFGYKVSKPRKARKATTAKSGKGPTCVVVFADGEVTRMTTHCPGDKLDWGRGERISRHAWASRHKSTFESSPPISSISFERDGAVLGERTLAGDKLRDWLHQTQAIAA